MAQVNPAPQAKGAWLGVLAVLMCVMTTSAAIVWVWWRGQQAPQHPVERYIPIVNGHSVRLRVVGSDGSISFDTINIAQRPASDLIRDATTQRFVSVVEGLGYATNNDNLLRLLSVEKAARLREVEQTGEVVTATESLMLVQPHAVSLVELIGPDYAYVYQPPVPLIRDDLALSQPWVITGTISLPAKDLAGPYTATLTLVDRDAITLDDLHLTDCLNIELRFVVGRVQTGHSRSRYCAEVGLVQQELFDVDGSLLKSSRAIALHTAAGRNWHSAAPTDTLPALDAPPLPRQLPANPALTGVLTKTWTYEAADAAEAVTARPIVVADLLLFAAERGELIAVARDDGAVRWRFQAGGAIYAAPAIANGSSRGIVVVGSVDKHVYGLDLRTGSFLWSFATRDAVQATPVIDPSAGVAYVAGEDGTLYALDVRTGQALRQRKLGGPLGVAPALSGDTVYVGSDDGALYAIHKNMLTVRWAFATGNAISAAPVVQGEVVYAASHNGSVFALKTNPTMREGETLWEWKPRFQVLTMLANGDTLYAATASTLHAIDPTTGQERWKLTGRSLFGALVLVGDQLFVQSVDGVQQVDATTGQLRSTSRISEASNYAGLTSDGERIYATYFDGRVYALHALRVQ